jgi:hypothetical protein
MATMEGFRQGFALGLAIAAGVYLLMGAALFDKWWREKRTFEARQERKRLCDYWEVR